MRNRTRLSALALAWVCKAASAENYPCSGKKGGVDHCEGTLFVCTDGTYSASTRSCDPAKQATGNQRGGAFSGLVVAVKDGDTLIVREAGREPHRVRLAGIDAPETRQPGGTEARESLAALTLGRLVYVDTHKTDLYGRDVGKLMLDGYDLGFHQVRLGYAWHYKAYEREQSAVDRTAYGEAESQARAAGLGLWAAPDPMPPWKFRHPQR